MTATVITICTSRKLGGTDGATTAAQLPAGSTDEVAEEWILRISSAPRARTAGALYSGRGFRDAEAANLHLGGTLRIVSAGLGLVSAETPSPAYGLTLIPQHAEGILGKISGDAADWWRALTQRSPFHKATLPDEGLILAALSAPYLAMVARDWSTWPAERRRRLRLFSKAPPSGDAAMFAEAWMPYDDRLDAIGKGRDGTQADFAQRALRHFTETLSAASVDAVSDAARVRDALDGLEARITPKRTRMHDAAIMALISAEWDAAGGRSGAMLRRLRDDLGVACEQSRLKDLFRKVAEARTAVVAP